MMLASAAPQRKESTRSLSNGGRLLAPIWAASLWAMFLTVAIGGVWIGPGYWFAVDFPGPRHFYFPTSISSHSVLEASLAVLSVAMPPDVVGKVLVASTLFVAALTSFLACPIEGWSARIIASTIYVVNPFVYDRLLYGQVTILAGYAALPWVVARSCALLVVPTRWNAMVCATALSAVAMLDLHEALIAATIMVCLTLTHIVVGRHSLRYVGRAISAVSGALLLAVLANWYWLLAMLLGRGPEAQTLARISSGDLVAFKAVPDQFWGLWPNLIALYGFWAEGVNRFVSMKSFVPGWVAVGVFMASLAVLGAAYAGQSNGEAGLSHGPARAIGLFAASGIALVLYAGLSSHMTAPIVDGLVRVWPLYRGMRDPSKWASVIALTYSQFVPVGISAIQRSFQHLMRRRCSNAAAVRAMCASAALAIVLYGGNGAFYGLHGQIRPSAYPKGWYSADYLITRDQKRGLVLFLPWHGYMAMGFVQNVSQVVANPAPYFFSTPLVASSDPEIAGVTPASDWDQLQAARLIRAGPSGHWAEELANEDIEYVLVARYVDWRRYSFLDDQVGLVKVADFGSIVVYRNLNWVESANSG